MKELLTAVQIFATFSVGVAALYISYKQQKINHTKMLFDLSQERYSVYVAFNKYVVAALINCNEIPNETSRDFSIALAKSRFIFDPHVKEYLDTIWGDIVFCQISKLPDEAAERAELKKRLNAELIAADVIFSPYLKITTKQIEATPTIKSHYEQLKEALGNYFKWQ